jgi:hypothetical protein
MRVCLNIIGPGSNIKINILITINSGARIRMAKADITISITRMKKLDHDCSAGRRPFKTGSASTSKSDRTKEFGNRLTPNERYDLSKGKE